MLHFYALSQKEGNIIIIIKWGKTMKDTSPRDKGWYKGVVGGGLFTVFLTL